MFYAILSNFDFSPWKPPQLPNPQKWNNTRFGLMYVWTEKNLWTYFFKKIFSQVEQLIIIIIYLLSS